MRQAVIILSIFAFIVSSCKQATKNQGEAVNKDNTENTNILQYGGVYTFGDDNPEGPTGEVYIYPENDSTALFYLFKSRGAPSYNMGSIDGRITVHNGKATFRKQYEYFENECILHFEFGKDSLTVIEDENNCDCGFGYGVYINNTFKRTSSEIPQYYTTMTNEKVYFARQQADYQSADEEETAENAESSENNFFVVPSDWEGVECKEYQEDDGYTQIQECKFPNANLKQVYDIVKKLVPDVKEELPANNIKYGNLEDENVIVTYTYENPKHLHIELSYGGGVTTVKIVENEKETISTITHSAD